MLHLTTYLRKNQLFISEPLKNVTFLFSHFHLTCQFELLHYWLLTQQYTEGAFVRVISEFHVAKFNGNSIISTPTFRLISHVWLLSLSNCITSWLQRHCVLLPQPPFSFSNTWPLNIRVSQNLPSTLFYLYNLQDQFTHSQSFSYHI